MIWHITPHPLMGTIAAPASKSYAHRYLIAAYLANQAATIHAAGRSRDVLATLAALQSMGLQAVAHDNDMVVQGATRTQSPTVYCHESGSTLRFLLPVAAAVGMDATLTAAPSLLSRPIDGLVRALNANGAQIDGLHVAGRLHAGRYMVDASVSSQYVSGLLLALPLLDGDSRIVLNGAVGSARYIDITLDVMRQFGVNVHPTVDGYMVQGNQRYRAPQQVTVEGDYSGAAFWLAAAAIGGDVTVQRLLSHSKQGDSRITEVLRAFGADVQTSNDTVRVQQGRLHGAIVDVDDIPDLAQIVAVVAAYAHGTTTLTGIGRLRYKESDRIQAIVRTLQTAGIECQVLDNALHIQGGTPHGGTFDGGNDHRTVMSAAILAAYAHGDSTLVGAEAVDKSYPDFARDYQTLGGIVWPLL